MRAQAVRAEADLTAARCREQELAQALGEAQERALAPPAPDSANRISPAEMAALQTRMAQAEAELDVANARARALARALDAATSSVQMLPPTDLIIAIDTTSSMTGEVASLREEIAAPAAVLQTDWALHQQAA